MGIMSYYPLNQIGMSCDNLSLGERELEKLPRGIFASGTVDIVKSYTVNETTYELPLKIIWVAVKGIIADWSLYYVVCLDFDKVPSSTKNSVNWRYIKRLWQDFDVNNWTFDRVARCGFKLIDAGLATKLVFGDPSLQQRYRY